MEKKCTYCEINTGGEHESGCPLKPINQKSGTIDYTYTYTWPSTTPDHVISTYDYNTSVSIDKVKNGYVVSLQSFRYVFSTIDDVFNFVRKHI